MIRNPKKQLILTSAVTLLPVLTGLLLWNELPDSMTTHWGIDGAGNGFSPKWMAVILLPMLLLVLHVCCMGITLWDPGNRRQSPKVVNMVSWICPVTSLLCCGLVQATGLGWTFPAAGIFLLLIGGMFVVFGNYMPKCRRNMTIGIKVKWALANEENWNATHRLAGRVWVVGGLWIMGGVFLPETAIPWVLMTAIVVLTTVPAVYSYRYYRKQVAAGTAPAKAEVTLDPAVKTFGWVGTGVGVLIAAAALAIMVTGDITVEYGDTAFTVKATYWTDLTVAYDNVAGIHYCENEDAGSRVSGFGSPRLEMGDFESSQFGAYTRYAYTACRDSVALTVNGRTLVLSGKDEDATRALYDALCARCPDAVG